MMDEITQEMEALELQTLQGFWRIEKLLEDIYVQQQKIYEEIRLIRTKEHADI